MCVCVCVCVCPVLKDCTGALAGCSVAWSISPYTKGLQVWSLVQSTYRRNLVSLSHWCFSHFLYFLPLLSLKIINKHIIRGGLKKKTAQKIHQADNTTYTRKVELQAVSIYLSVYLFLFFCILQMFYCAYILFWHPEKCYSNVTHHIKGKCRVSPSRPAGAVPTGQV